MSCYVIEILEGIDVSKKSFTILKNDPNFTKNEGYICLLNLQSLWIDSNFLLQKN